MTRPTLPPRGWGYRARGYESSGRKASDLPAPPKGPAGVSKAVPASAPALTGKDYQRAVKLDYRLIVEAQEFYEAEGFSDTAVPWVVGSEAYEETKPQGALPYATLGGFLVASAEQSFLQLMLQGQELGRAQATSPCFRDEVHDEIHSPYFLKLELIDTVTVNQAGLEQVVLAAEAFFSRYLPTRVETFEDGSYDLVCRRSGLELGSYGIRRHGAHGWVYGTGVALPRLSQALAALC